MTLDRRLAAKGKKSLTRPAADGLTARMKRFAILAVMMLSVAACGQGGGSDAVAASAAPRSPAGGSAGAAASALDRFAGELLRQLDMPATGNVLVSPFSLIAALLMTRAGSVGVTRAEIDGALHLDSSGDVDAAFNTLDQLLASRAGDFVGPDGKTRKVQLASANAVWAQRGYPFEAAYLDRLARDFGAGVRLVDYRSNAAEARRTINRWVAERTSDKIDELIPDGVLDAMTRLVLTNAIYMNAAWAEPFEPTATRTAPFHRLDGSTVDVPFLRQTNSVRYSRGPGWQSVELPYAGGKLAMQIVLPDEGRLATVEGLLSNGLSAFSDAATETVIELSLPKFKYRVNRDLVDVLVAMGIRSLFGADADLSGITTAERLYVSDIIHEAVIDVSEYGTEAAAATAVVIKATAAPTPPIAFIVDRPFLFSIRDVETKVVIFAGRVVDPAQRAT